MSRMLLIVTGASRGLGQAIAASFAKNENPTTISHLRALLLARSVEGLLETETMIKKAAKQSELMVDLSVHVVDLSDLDNLDENIDGIFDCVYNRSQYDRTVLINNAGSLGHIGPAVTMPSLKELRNAIDFNVTSTMWLSSRFVKLFSVRNGANRPEGPKCTVVNISSLCALHPFKTQAPYCTSKVAREMFHAVLAQEEGGSTSNVKVLNYAPGACETEMTQQLRKSDVLDHGMKDFFTKAYEDGTLVKLEDTSKRLANLVLTNDFESGKHIDYWDVVNSMEL